MTATGFEVAKKFTRASAQKSFKAAIANFRSSSATIRRLRNTHAASDRYGPSSPCAPAKNAQRRRSLPPPVSLDDWNREIKRAKRESKTRIREVASRTTDASHHSFGVSMMRFHWSRPMTETKLKLL